MSEAEKYMNIVEGVVNALEKVDSVTDMMAVVATSVDTWGGNERYRYERN